MGDDGGFVGVVPEGIAALANALSDLHGVLLQNASTVSVTMQAWESLLGQRQWTPSNFAPLAIDRQRWVYDQAVAMKRRSDLAQELQEQTVHEPSTGIVHVNGMPQSVGGGLVTPRT